MTISCTLCNQFFKSLIIENGLALNECCTQLVQHLQKDHPQHAKDLIQDHILITANILGYLLLSKFSKYTDEPFVSGEVSKLESKLKKILGFEEGIA